MTKKSKTTLKIIAITLYAILVLPLLLGSLNVIVDSFVPRNLVEHHYMTQYRLIDSPQDMEENLSVTRYKHNSSGEILTNKEVALLEKDTQADYTVLDGWRYVCTANNIDYCIVSENVNGTVKTYVAMRLFDEFIPWQIGTVVSVVGSFLVLNAYLILGAALVKKFFIQATPCQTNA